MLRMRTREGTAVARGKGKLRGKARFSDRQAGEPRRMYDTGEYSVSGLAEVFSVSRPTVYRTLERQPTATYRSSSQRGGLRAGHDKHVLVGTRPEGVPQPLIGRILVPTTPESSPCDKM